eukprot:7349152-Alexandrium_andersonii.AAC.1
MAYIAHAQAVRSLTAEQTTQFDIVLNSLTAVAWGDDADESALGGGAPLPLPDAPKMPAVPQSWGGSGIKAGKTIEELQS